MITLTETLIILDIKKTESNNCFIIHLTKKNRNQEGGGEYVKRVYINVSLNTRMYTSHRNVDKVLGAYKMEQETMFRTTTQNSHKYTSLKLFRKVSLKCTKLNPFCEHF